MARRKPGEQARRDQRARSLGYRNEYDYRVHDYGRIPPTMPQVRGAELRRLRGHASLADLDRELRAGRVELLNVQGVRGARGQYQRVDFVATLDSGESIEFSISGAQPFDQATIDRLHDAVDEGGGTDRIMIVGSPPGLVGDLTTYGLSGYGP